MLHFSNQCPPKAKFPERYLYKLYGSFSSSRHSLTCLLDPSSPVSANSLHLIRSSFPWLIYKPQDKMQQESFNKYFEYIRRFQLEGTTESSAETYPTISLATRPQQVFRELVVPQGDTVHSWEVAPVRICFRRVTLPIFSPHLSETIEKCPLTLEDKLQSLLRG